MEKIGTNRRLLDRIVLLDFEKPFDLIPYYKSTYDKEFSEEKRSKNYFSSPQKSESPIWSGRPDLNRGPQRPERCALNQTAPRPGCIFTASLLKITHFLQQNLQRHY